MIQKSQTDSETRLLVLCIGQTGKNCINSSFAKRVKQITSLLQICFSSELWNEGVCVQMTPYHQNENRTLHKGTFSNGFLNVLGYSCQRACIVPLKQKLGLRNRKVFFLKVFSMTHCLDWLVFAPGSSFGPEWSLVWLLSMLHRIVM